jgi:hypothetical protein
VTQGDGVATITCEDGRTATVRDGADGARGIPGTSCSVSQQDGVATITCEDGATALVRDGADGTDGAQGPQGDPGEQGPAGQSCTVAQGEGEATITCEDGTTATIRDGEGMADINLVSVSQIEPGGQITGGSIFSVFGQGSLTVYYPEGGVFSVDLGRVVDARSIHISANSTSNRYAVLTSEDEVRWNNVASSNDTGQMELSLGPNRLRYLRIGGLIGTRHYLFINEIDIRAADSPRNGLDTIMNLDSFSGILDRGCDTPPAACPDGWSQVSFQNYQFRGCRRVCLTASACSVLYLDSSGGQAGFGCRDTRPASCPETYTEVDEQTIGGHEDDGRNCRKTCLRCP